MAFVYDFFVQNTGLHTDRYNEKQEIRKSHGKKTTFYKRYMSLKFGNSYQIISLKKTKKTLRVTGYISNCDTF